MLWNASDHLARSRGTLSKAAASLAASSASFSRAGFASIAASSGAPRPSPLGLPPPPPTATTIPTTSPTPFEAAGGIASSIGSTSAMSDGLPERQPSAAFTAALSFAHGVPTLPGRSSTPPSPTTNRFTQQQQQQDGAASVTLGTGLRGGEAVSPVPIPAGGAVALFSGPPVPYTGGHDLNEAESIAMLMIAFRSLKSLSVDRRPEVSNQHSQKAQEVAVQRTDYRVTCVYELAWTALPVEVCELACC